MGFNFLFNLVIFYFLYAQRIFLFPFSWHILSFLCFVLQWMWCNLLNFLLSFILSPLFSVLHTFHCPFYLSLLFLLLHTLKDCEESVPTEEPRKSKGSSACGCVCVFLCVVCYTVGAHVWGHANSVFCRSSQHTSSLFN